MSSHNKRSSSFVARLIVEPYLHGVRVDSFLVRHFRNYTPFRIQRIVQAGLAWIDDVRAAGDERMQAGQRVAVRLVEPPDKLIEPEPLPLEILYEDPWLLAVNKPAGWIAHPVGNTQCGTLANAVQQHLDEQTARPGLLRPGIVHRLDRMTSGVILISKEHLSHRLLSIQFQQKRIEKSYLAIVEGLVEADAGAVDFPIGRHPQGGTILMSAAATARDARPARTDFEVLRRYDSHTLVRAVPRTGRLHQIRVHMAAAGHAIAGDEFYAAGDELKPSRFDQPEGAAKPQSEAAGPPGRHALHAYELTVRHPVTSAPLKFTASPPAEFFDICCREECLEPRHSAKLKGS